MNNKDNQVSISEENLKTQAFVMSVTKELSETLTERIKGHSQDLDYCQDLWRRISIDLRDAGIFGNTPRIDFFI